MKIYYLIPKCINVLKKLISKKYHQKLHCFWSFKKRVKMIALCLSRYMTKAVFLVLNIPIYHSFSKL